MTSTADVSETAEDAWEKVARIGYVVSGLVHFLIGVLALQLALGDTDKQADQTGALSALAKEPFGATVLWISVVGFVALGAWQLAKAAHVGQAQHTDSSTTGDRLKAIGRAVVYFALAAAAFSWTSGAGSSSSNQTQGLTADLLKVPAGQLLVGAIGLAIIGVGIYHVVKGWREKFLEDLTRLPSGHAGRGTRWAGKIGYVAKGIALGIVGGLFITAAVQHDASEASGLDGAMHTLKESPAGTVLLVLVAIGLMAFGVYCFVRARYGRL